MVNPDSLEFNDPDAGWQSGRIDVLGRIISIIGESISTYAIALAFEEERNEEKSGSNNEVLVNELREMREQIQYLTNEIQSLKKNGVRDSPWRL